MGNRIRIVSLLGSMRPGNMTGKALALVNAELEARDDVELDFIDPAKLRLGSPGQPSDPASRKRLQEAVSAATGVVLSTPEYHGSYSSVVKVLIENMEFPSALSGKPVALLGVAAGSIGAIKALEHLRSICSHVGAIVLPGPVSVANVNDVFDEDGNCLDAAIEKRIRRLGTNLVAHIQQTICPRIALEEMVREPRN